MVKVTPVGYEMTVFVKNGITQKEWGWHESSFSIFLCQIKKMKSQQKKNQWTSDDSYKMVRQSF